MSLRFGSWLALALCIGLLAVSAALAWPDDPPPPPPEEAQTQPGVEVQARGPVHEAYAAPSDQRPLPSPLVSEEPPAPANEVAPDQKPADEDVEWIPGYWSFDEDSKRFVWVSGLWRVPPPGRQWVPGSWQEVEGGWYWVAGYWADGGQTQLEYLSTPPPSLDNGPEGSPPDATSDFVPGCWVYRDARYRWRPGFWLPHREGWQWEPPHYIWTTVGYVFVEGYWDRPLLDRGLLFAPVSFDQQVAAAADFSYDPRFVVWPDSLLGALFVRTANCHYYFGDYFDEGYTRRGFVPWIDYRINRVAYDPSFGYYRREFGREAHWEQGLRALYEGRFNGSVPRPPHTLVQQAKAINTLTTNKTWDRTVNKTVNVTNVQNLRVVAPLKRINDARVTGLVSLAFAPGAARPEARREAEAVMHLARVTGEEHARYQKTAATVRELTRQRAAGEAQLLRDLTGGQHALDAPRIVKVDRTRERPPANAPPAPRSPERAPERAAPPPSRPVEKAPPPPPEKSAPRPVERPAAPAPQPAPRMPPPPPRTPRTPPAPPVLPKHEDRPIPHHEPPKQPKPPPPRPAPKPEPPKPEPKKGKG
jgi:hypothetical protein